MKYFFYPLALLYGLITTIRNILYNYGFLEIHSLNIPVLSVGNITVGGTGKTPLVRYLAEKLISMGYHPGIISRGYGRTSKSQVIVHNGEKIMSTWLNSGDEPFLLASWLNTVPIVVDNNRIAAARTLIRKFKIDIIILDDGFQHRQLHRNIDLVLFNSFENKSSLKMFPLGRLRETLKNLSRCDILIFTKSNNNNLNEIKNIVNVPLPDRVLSSSNKYKIIRYNDKKTVVHTKLSQPTLAFCGIGDPKSFKVVFKSMEINIDYYKIFKDHVKYSVRDLKLLLNEINDLGINSVVTTEKDVLKLPDWFLGDVDIFILQMRVEFPPQQEVVLMESVKKVFL